MESQPLALEAGRTQGVERERENWAYGADERGLHVDEADVLSPFLRMFVIAALLAYCLLALRLSTLAWTHSPNSAVITEVHHEKSSIPCAELGIIGQGTTGSRAVKNTVSLSFAHFCHRSQKMDRHSLLCFPQIP